MAGRGAWLGLMSEGGVRINLVRFLMFEGVLVIVLFWLLLLLLPTLLLMVLLSTLLLPLLLLIGLPHWLLLPLSVPSLLALLSGWALQPLLVPERSEPVCALSRLPWLALVVWRAGVRECSGACVALIGVIGCGC